MSYDILSDKFVCNICTVIPCQCSEPVKIVPVNNLTSQIQNSVMGSNTSFLTKDEEDDKGNDSGIEDSFATGSENKQVKSATVAKTVLQYKSQKNHEKYKFPSKEKEEENLQNMAVDKKLYQGSKCIKIIKMDLMGKDIGEKVVDWPQNLP